METDQLAVVLKDVTKRMRERVILDRLTFTVSRGEIFVLAGPNGAGKTTSMRIIVGLLRRDSGLVRVLGVDPESGGWGRVKMRIGYLPEDARVYERLTGMENIIFYARLYSRSREELESMVARAIAITGLSRADLERRAGYYSKGMKRRLLLAITMMHDPDLLILDEPTSGLDVVSSYHIKRLLREAASRGKTVIVTTHDLKDAEILGDTIAFMSSGRIIFKGTVSQALDEYSAESLEEAYVRAVSG